MDGNCGGGQRDFSSGKWRVSVVKAPTPASTALNDYNERLAEVLRSRDVFRFRHFLATSGRALPDEMLLDTLKMATMMHQMILSLPQLADLHDFSREWLDENTVLTSKNSSLNEAAQRKPGATSSVPEPQPGKRSISLRPLPKSKN